MSRASRYWSAVAFVASSVALTCCKEATPPSPSEPVTESRSEPANPRVGSAVCRECHQELHTTYHETVAMARSFYVMTPDREVEDWRHDNTFHHERSGLHYRMERRGDRYFQRRWKLDPEGRTTSEFEREITHVMGSGNNVRTYVNYTQGHKATQLPVSWYAETGSWAISPGYDTPEHADFQRAIDHGCMFCHNAYPEVPDTDFDGSRYSGELPSGIDCERCHGHGGRHVALARDDSSTYQQVLDAIIDPSELDQKRAMDVCLQCHLETAVTPGLPHSLRRFDRDVFSFQPGEALEDFLLPFDAATDAGQEDRFEIAHHGYRLMQSRCFVESKGAMICTTCHDPHHTPAPAEGRTHFRDRCYTCHQADSCTVAHAAPAESGIAADDCVACHMPRRRTIDVVHAVMRDHRIVRRPPAGDLLAAIEERHVAYEGDLAFYLPATAPRGAEADLYLGTAYLQGGIHVQRGIDLVEQALANGAPEAATPYRMVGDAKSHNRDFGGALSAFEKALELAPKDAAIRSKTGAMLLLLGRDDEARQHFEQVLRAVPDHADSLFGLYRLAARHAQADAQSLLERAVAAAPENNRARHALGQLLLRAADPAGARRHFEQILRVDPRDADAELQIGLLERQAGNWSQALLRARAALQLDAGHQQAQLLAATVYTTAPDAALRDGPRALAHVRSVMRDQPIPSARVLLIAAAAHAECGDLAEAVRNASAALSLAQVSNDQRLTQQINRHLQAYRARQPSRQPL